MDPRSLVVFTLEPKAKKYFKRSKFYVLQVKGSFTHNRFFYMIRLFKAQETASSLSRLRMVFKSLETF